MKKNNKKIIIYIGIITIFLFMSIGYAIVNEVTFKIEGDLANIPQEGVFITEVVLNNSDNAIMEETKVLNYFQTTLNSIITLSMEDVDSSVTYDVTVYNNSNTTYTFIDTIYDSNFYSNENITFEIINLNKEDLLEPKEYKTFQIKFYYLDKTNITNNVLESYINFNFEIKTWQSITNYGMENFEIINSSDGKFITVNYTSVPAQYEKINLPLNDLEVGEIYQLTFTTWNDNVMIETVNSKTLVYGCTVMPSPSTDYLDPKKLIAYDNYNSGFMWKTLDVNEQTVTLTFKATNETMYWIWDLSLIEDVPGTLYIKDISIEKSIKPTGAYIDVPNTSIYQKEYLATNEEATVTIQKGTYITKADYDDLVLKVQTAGGYEFINIPMVNLTIGKTYTISFSNLTTGALKNNLRYGTKVQNNKQEGGGQLISETDYNINTTGIVNAGTVTFTATANTMYWVWDLGGLEDYKWASIRIYDILLY